MSSTGGVLADSPQPRSEFYYHSSGAPQSRALSSKSLVPQGQGKRWIVPLLGWRRPQDTEASRGKANHSFHFQSNISRGAHALPAGGRGDMCREAKRAENYYSFIPSTGISVPTSVLDTGLLNKEKRDAVVLSYIPFQMRGGGRRAEAGLWQGYSPVHGTRGREGAILQEGRGIRARLYGEGETSAES